MNETVSPDILTALQEQLLEHKKRLQTEISALRSAEDEGGKPSDDSSLVLCQSWGNG